MKELYKVTLAWGWDRNGGNYTTSVWAESEGEAVRLTAEEMADNGAVMFDSKKERREWIKERTCGFCDVYITADQLKGDLELLFTKELFSAERGAVVIRPINMVELGKVLAENRERIVVSERR